MSHLEITEEDRAQHRKERTLADLLPTAPPEVEPLRLRRSDLAAIVAGLFLAFALVVLVERVMPAAPPAANVPSVAPYVTAQEPRRATIAPSPIPEPTSIPTTAPTASPIPPTPILPTPEPVVVVQILYSSSMTVYDSRGYPLGQVTGESWSSQADADAQAAALAEQMREGR